MSAIDLTNDDLAQRALLVMYAWDMCDADSSPGSTQQDPRIAAAGWTILGFISAADDIVTSGPGGIRQQRVSASADADRKRYGYVATNAVGDQLCVVIRGTDGAEEWFDNFVFVAAARDGYPGRVEMGFHDIFRSMTLDLLNAGAAAPQSLAQGVADLAQQRQRALGKPLSVLVVGHSLGAALATYVTYDLAGAISANGQIGLQALFFASPKTGDHDWVDAFSKRVSDYLVLNYEQDLVPKVPPFDITHLDLYRTLPNCRVITDDTAAASVNEDDKGCCHHLICYVAMLSPPSFTQAMQDATCAADDKKCAVCVISLQGVPVTP